MGALLHLKRGDAAIGDLLFCSGWFDFYLNSSGSCSDGPDSSVEPPWGVCARRSVFWKDFKSFVVRRVIGPVGGHSD